MKSNTANLNTNTYELTENYVRIHILIVIILKSIKRTIKKKIVRTFISRDPDVKTSIHTQTRLDF